MATKFPRRFRRNKRFFEPGNVLVNALEKSGLTDQARRMKILLAWRQAVGPKVAQHTIPDGFSRGVLIIRTDSAPWRNELVYLRDTLKEKLNDALGGDMVKEIKVMHGRIYRDPPERAPDSGPPDPEALAFAQETAEATIQDPELQALFANAMARGIKDGDG